MTDPTPPSEADYDEATRLYDEACADSRTEGIEWIARALAARTERATVAEREACASLVEFFREPRATIQVFDALAAAIRGRKA